jgi:hypothetical protein
MVFTPTGPAYGIISGFSAADGEKIKIKEEAPATARRTTSCHLARKWQVDGEGGPHPLFTFEGDGSLVVLDDSENRCKAKPDAVTLFLGGKERLEYVRLVFGRNSLAGISDRNPHRFFI